MAVQKEEVVISGIGGVFPECDSLEDLKDLLFNKTNGITIDSRRWRPNELGAIAGTGKMKNVDKFDATFFSAHPKLAESMDAMTRIYIERSIEAIFDAGLSPADLRGTNTAVFSGSAISETEMFSLDSSKFAAFSMLGRSRTMQANRVSYILNLTGPSFTMDGGWICGSNALEKAKKMIENGFISSAIVGVTNLTLRPEIQFQFQGLNRLNKNIQTKSFSSDADGYNRSEACIVMYLQKASEAKRSYGTLLSVRSIQFGDHEGHITEHNGNNLKSLLLDSYKLVNIDPASIEFIEAYGSGIKTEDAMELNIMDEVFCTKQRKFPLKVGSVKSNIGHCEVSGLFMSIVKAIIILESGYIPPNINYLEPNKSVAALKNGKIQVINEKTPFNGDIIGINSFGLLNAFSHVILKRNIKEKQIFKHISSNDFIPRLILASGRNEENTRATVKKIKCHGNDPEYLALTNDVFTRNINAHFFRSFSIFPTLDESRIDEVWNVDMKKRQIWFIFSGMGSQWHGMGTDLMKLPVFADAINKCDITLKPLGVDIKYILTSQNPKIFDNILNSFVGIAAVQIGLVEVLKALDIIPDGIIGHSVGELGCAYADGCFTAEEMILSAYARGRASLETELIPGMMAAIGLGYDQIKDKLPHDIDVACHNSATSCTISGPVDSINEFVSELKSKGVFAKAVNVAGIAFHSRYIQSAGPTLLKYLKDVIRVPKKRSSRWVSSSLPETKWELDLSKYSSPEYHTNNLLSSVLFEDVLKHIPSDAIVIEIAPHGLLQAILKEALPETVTNVPLTKRMYGDSIRFLLSAIGKLYANGVNLRIQNIYPKISFPVSRGTPSIQSLPFWDHNEQWTPVVTTNSQIHGFFGERTTTILVNDSIHLTEYQVHNLHIIPFAYIMINTWEMFVEINSKTFSEESVQFDNLRFKNNIKVHPNNVAEGNLMIQWGSGHFEYYLNDEVIFSGQISFLNNIHLNRKTEKPIECDITSDQFQGCVLKDEIYEIFKNNGFNLGENFKNITKFNIYKNYIQGNIKWKNDWIYFLDGLFKFPILQNLGTCPIETPISIRQISINPTMLKTNTERDVCVNYNTATKEITCDGIKITDIKYGHSILPVINSAVVNVQEEIFIQFNLSQCKNINHFIYDSMDIITDTFDKTSEKLILCTPYHFDDLLSKLCTKTIKQIFENQLTMHNETLNWHDIENVPENDESRRFITVTNVNYLQDTTRALVNIKCSFIIVCSENKLKDLKDWKIITQQKFDNNCCLGLMKKVIVLDKNVISIKPTNDEYDLSIWKALETHNNSSKDMIYIISRSEPLEGINVYVNEILQKYKSKKLRFLFILDSNAPDFDSNQTFYTNQLSKDLIVNIYKNGGWGSYKKIVLQDLKNDIKFNKNLVFKNLTKNNKSKLTVKYLGLNFKEIVVEENTENEFGPLEYSGYIDNKTIMGITSFEKISSQMIYDPLLSWPIPSTWSLEEATTIPLAYAMNYYIFNILCKLQKDNSVLVTSGLHPIGQAAIAISLSIKCETYAIVNSHQQAEQLSSIFPELLRSRILVNTNNKFDVQLKMITKSKGIDFILNFLSGKSFEASFRTLAKHGSFFNFSKADMKNQKYLGTRIFLQDTSFFTISSGILLNESVLNKQIVQQALMNGLNEGVLKPIRNYFVITSLNGINIFNTMRSNAVSIKSEKVVLSIDDNNNNDESSKLKEKLQYKSYECHPNKTYLIVGNRGDWLDLAEWLVDRGAQKIVIIVKRCLMSSTICRRFDRLISRNVSVQIESDLHLKSKEESLNWLNNLTNFKVLDSIFIVNQFDIDKINNLRYAFEKHTNRTLTSSFVCLLSNGNSICSELKSIGLNALNISWDGMSSQMTNTSKILPSLDILLQKSYTAESSSFVCSEHGSFKSESYQQINNIITNIFPESSDELHFLNNIQTQEIKFVEVSTRSPRLSQLKSVIPVFIIPGFKPKLIKTFFEKLSYPVFEAQLSNDIKSIDEVSQILVNKLKKITNQKYVSIIGESWGGTVALKMAQILEAQGTLTTVTLLEGDPEMLAECAKQFLSNGYITKKLNTVYGSLSSKFSKHPIQNYNEESQLINMSAYQKQFEENTQKALNTIRYKLQTLLETKPLSNKIHSKVVIFRYEKTSKFNSTNLKDYCLNPPFVHIISGMDYKHMMVDKKMISIINNNIVHSYPIGVELSLSDKYKNFYFYMQKYL
ncbi:fatty acid synthase-like, partial [Rhopalosiphum maidis]|uniref:fatty acid synthase-like n=1 Tax=Rhopalosiphum maidis TaxID=43146 RepID=UPI000F00CAA2